MNPPLLLTCEQLEMLREMELAAENSPVLLVLDNERYEGPPIGTQGPDGEGCRG